jgi:hypothetical protein
MKKFTILMSFILLTVITGSAFANSMLGIDFDKPINTQFAGDPYTTWVDGGIEIAEPHRGVKYITINVAGFDEDGNTMATGEFFIKSNDMPDQANCQKVSLIIKKLIPQGTRLSSYYSKDDFGCEEGYSNSWSFVYGGDINPQ